MGIAPGACVPRPRAHRIVRCTSVASERSLALTQAFGLDRMSDSQQLATPISMLVGALSCQLRAVSSLSAAV